MNRLHLGFGIPLLAGLLIANITHADAPTTRPADSNELADLRRTVHDLRNENMALRKVLEDRQRQLDALSAPHLSLDPLKLNAQSNGILSTLPPGAMPYLFNGAIYYTIPVNAQPR